MPTERDIIRDASRFMATVHGADENCFPANTYGKTLGQVRKELAALDLDTCQAADVEAALGIPGWATKDHTDMEGDLPYWIG